MQAKEFGEAEVWMNERLMRAAPAYFAEFITAFEDSEQRRAPQRGPVRYHSPSILTSCPSFHASRHWLAAVLWQGPFTCMLTHLRGDFLHDVCLSSDCVQEPLWLVWRYEGDFTLYDLMQKKDWPYNLEPLLFGRDLNIPKSPERRWLSLRLVMKQVLTWASI